MFELKVPLAVAMEEHTGVYAGTGGLSIDAWTEAYVESGDALREWVQRWAVAQQTLITWTELYGAGTTEEGSQS